MARSRSAEGLIANARRARAAHGDETTAVAFRLPPGLLEKLKAAADAEDSDVSKEIRRRLESSFEMPDAPTEALASAIAYVTSMLAIEGNWWNDSYLLQIVILAVAEFLAPVRDILKEAPPPERSHKLFAESVTPEAAAKVLIAMHRQSKGI